MFFEGPYDAGNGRRFLTDGDVDTDDARILLIQNRIDGNGRLARAAVADDEFTLATADRDHGVDGFQACLERYLDRLAVGNTVGLDFDKTGFRRLDVPLAVNGHP